MTAWTAPRTWVAGELVTASIMNTHVRDNLLHAKEQVNIALDRALVIGFGDTAGSVLTTGVKGYIYCPFAGAITGWTLVADASGNLVVDVWKDVWANFPPTVADTIAGTEKPTLSGAQKAQDLSLTTWTTAIADGDVLAFKVDSAATVKQATLTLSVLVSG